MASVVMLGQERVGTCTFYLAAAGTRLPDDQHSGWPTATLVPGTADVDKVYDRLGETAAQAVYRLGIDSHGLNHIYAKVLEYPPGAHGLEWHTDRYVEDGGHLVSAGLIEPWQMAEMQGRVLSIMIQLSDPADYDGGLLELIDEDTGETVTAPTAQGSIVVATADTRHRVTPIERGTRLSLVCFVGHSPRGGSVF